MFAFRPAEGKLKMVFMAQQAYFRRALFCFLVFLSLTAISRAQTTQGLISGQVIDLEDGNPIPNARVTYLSLATNTTGTALTSSFGFYFLHFCRPATTAFG